MADTRKVTNFLLLAGFILCLLQVWLPRYFLTGDGPCHVYNAQVLHDMWCHKNIDFYSKYYNIVSLPNPNWLSTIILAFLMFLVNGITAEKIFLTFYLLIYISGFYALLQKISGKISYLPLVILAFVFPQTLSKGFYNFSFSIAFYFWVVWGWLRFLDKKSIANALLFFLFTGLIFFTHLLAFGFAAITCAALTASYAIAAKQGNFKSAFTGFFLKHAAFLALLLAPFIILMKWFTENEGGMRMELKPHFYRLIELVQFKYLVNVTHIEDFLAEIAGIILVLLFSFSFLRTKKIRVHKYDGFLASLICVMFVYLLFPEAFLGKLILISMRAQVFVFILMVCCVAYRFPAGTIKKRDALFVFVCLLGFCVTHIAAFFATLPPAIDNKTAAGMTIITYTIVPAIVFLLILCSGFYKIPLEKIKNAAAGILFLCFVALTIARASCQLSASAAEVDYLSVGNSIKPYSVVLPLDFSPNGKDAKGKMIADRNWLFCHAAQYMGLEKPLIILDNYEANMGYFPISWNNNINPYTYLSKYESIEGQPPFATITQYKQTTGVAIDYILMWCYNPAYLQNEHFKTLYAEINSGYHIIYISPTNRTILFERN